MEEKKYELTKNKIEYDETTLYQIRALKDFSDVKKGDLGGYIEKESNLSQEGDCWIYDDSKVWDNAEVQDNAKVLLTSEVNKNAKVFGNAIVKKYSVITGNSMVCGKAVVYRYGCINGNVLVKDNAVIKDYCDIEGNIMISGDASITDDVYILGLYDYNDKNSMVSLISGKAKICNRAKIISNFAIVDNAIIYGADISIPGRVNIGGHAIISSKMCDKSYICVEFMNEEEVIYLTAFSSKTEYGRKCVMISSKYFTESLEFFEDRVISEDEDIVDHNIALSFISMVRAKFKDIA